MSGNPLQVQLESDLQCETIPNLLHLQSPIPFRTFNYLRWYRLEFRHAVRSSSKVLDVWCLSSELCSGEGAEDAAFGEGRHGGELFIVVFDGRFAIVSSATVQADAD